MILDQDLSHPLGFKFFDLIKVTEEAGKEIADIYSRSFETWEKDDKSPLTEADLAAHTIICRHLNAMTPEIAVLSEETSDAEKAELLKQRLLWVVDPLDGTREFVGRTGEFTVNIGLLDNETPLVGVVHVPLSGDTYIGYGNGLAFKLDKKHRQVPIEVRSCSSEPVMLVSRSHQKKLSESQTKGVCEVKAIGSSLKGCLIAEGLADVYIRKGPTSIWDTVAMHAVVASAGGQMLDLEGRPYDYSSRNLLNTNFVILGDKATDWRHLLDTCF